MRQAVEKASPDLEKVKECEQRLGRIAAELEKLEQGRQRILDLIVKGIVEQEQAETKLRGLKRQEERHLYR